MSGGFNDLSTDQKYELLRSLVKKVSADRGNSGEYSFQDQIGYVNLIGVRGFSKGKACKSTNTSYDDTLFVAYKDSGSSKRVEEFVYSTEYGQAGDAYLVYGQHKYQLNYHKLDKPYLGNLGTSTWVKNRKYRALRPYTTVRILRDSNRNLAQDESEVFENAPDINIHYGGEISPTTWSEGCQVVKGWQNFRRLIELVESDHSIKGTIDNEIVSKPSVDGTRALIYTLISGYFLEETLREIGGICFPIDFGNGRAVSEQTLEQYYMHTEKKNSGGYFPVGSNTVWHGGIHIFVPKGTEVHACLPGRIVAARLAEDTVAEGPYGSRNFILVKHERANSTFYSLYMHLKPLPSSKDNPSLSKLRWVGRSVIVGYRLTRSRNYRPQANEVKGEEKGTLKAGTEVEFVADAGGFWKKVKIKDVAGEWYMNLPAEVASEKREFVPDEELLNKLRSGAVVKLDVPVGGDELLWWSGDHGSVFHRTGLLHWEIFSEENVFDSARQSTENKENTSSQGGVSPANTIGTCTDAVPRKFVVRQVEGPALAYPSTDVTYRIIKFEPSNLTPEEKRDVNWLVTVEGQEVLKKEKHGDVLILRTKNEWVGMNIIVMPYRNAPSKNVSVVTRVANRKPIVWQTVEDNDDDFNMDSAVIANMFGEVWSSDEELSTEELKQFYDNNPNAKKLRTYACKFVSEWAIPDLDRAIDRIEMFIKRGLKERLSQYQWWEEAKNAGVDLPKSPKCWHYNPVTFMEALFIESGIPVAGGKNQLQSSSGTCETNWKEGFGRNISNQNKYVEYIAEASKKYNIDCKIFKSLIAQESSFDDKAANDRGFAGLTQVGGSAINEAGLNVGSTSKSTGKWVYDANDERFDPKKSVLGGAKVLDLKRKRIDSLFLARYKQKLSPYEQFAFYCGAYNAGEGVVNQAFKEANKKEAKWDDLVKESDWTDADWKRIKESADKMMKTPRTDAEWKEVKKKTKHSPLMAALLHYSWGGQAKYKEVTEYVDSIMKRAKQ